jgi:hypothetical protein
MCRAVEPVIAAVDGEEGEDPNQRALYRRIARQPVRLSDLVVDPARGRHHGCAARQTGRRGSGNKDEVLREMRGQG